MEGNRRSRIDILRSLPVLDCCSFSARSLFDSLQSLSCLYVLFLPSCAEIHLNCRFIKNSSIPTIYPSFFLGRYYEKLAKSFNRSSKIIIRQTIDEDFIDTFNYRIIRLNDPHSNNHSSQLHPELHRCRDVQIRQTYQIEFFLPFP